MIVLALDIAKNRTGWALGDPSWKIPKWGSFETRRWDDDPGHWLLEWYKFLVKMVDEHGVGMIAVEEFFIDTGHFNFNGTVPMAEMQGIVKLVAKMRGIRLGKASVASWRKRFLGTSAAPKWMKKPDERTNWLKKQAIEACIERGWYVTYHDEAEALGLLDFTLCSQDQDYARRGAPIFRRLEYKHDVAAVRARAGA